MLRVYRDTGSGIQRKPKAEGGARTLRKTLWQTRPHPKQKVTAEEFGAGRALKGSQCLRGKESACGAGATRDTGLIPGSGRLFGEGNGNPLQYSCVENPVDRGAWWATVQRVSKSRTGLSD